MTLYAYKWTTWRGPPVVSKAEHYCFLGHMKFLLWCGFGRDPNSTFCMWTKRSFENDGWLYTRLVINQKLPAWAWLDSVFSKRMELRNTRATSSHQWIIFLVDGKSKRATMTLSSFRAHRGTWIEVLRCMGSFKNSLISRSVYWN